ncbi:MAG TPA: hypothetical protein PKE51_09005, partial [Gemmatimonadaceae bacterium]|nr:hypothetical protein [Gemmatimonadaceae bacterium]
MASDDRRPPLPPDDAAAEAARIDDGLIHEWLDGQCDDVTAARFEALVHTVPAFAERVAEARGFTAAASRILGALDEVPGDVLPARPQRVDNASSAAPSRRRGPSRTLTQWSAIAAVLAVAATGVWMARPVSTPVTEMAMSVPLDAGAAATRLADDAVAPAASPMAAAPLGAAPTMVSLGEVLDTSAAARAIVEAARAPRPASPVVPTASADAPPTAAASTMAVVAGAAATNDLQSTAAEAPAARKASAAVASAESETREVASAAAARSAPAPAPALAARRALAASAPVERALG